MKIYLDSRIPADKEIMRAQLNIEKVENTSDADKPISFDTQAALNLKLDSSVYTANDIRAKLASNQEASREALGLGTMATSDAEDFAPADQGMTSEQRSKLDGIQANATRKTPTQI